MSSRRILFVNVSEDISGSQNCEQRIAFSEVCLIRQSFFDEVVAVVGLVPECP